MSSDTNVNFVDCDFGVGGDLIFNYNDKDYNINEFNNAFTVNTDTILLESFKCLCFNIRSIKKI